MLLMCKTSHFRTELFNNCPNKSVNNYNGYNAMVNYKEVKRGNNIFLTEVIMLLNEFNCNFCHHEVLIN